MTLETTKSAVQRWHTMLQNSDMSMLSELLANDVVFRSPVAYQPYVGKQVVFFILTNVIQVFENFTYHREFYTEEVAMLYLSFPPMWEIKNLKFWKFPVIPWGVLHCLRRRKDGFLQEISCSPGKCGDI